MAQTHKGPPPAIVAGIFTSLFLLSIIFSRVLTHGAALSGFFQLGAAITLGVLTASLTSRLLFLGVTASGAHIAFFGGMAGSVFLVIPDLSGTGEVAHIAFFGLLTAGVAVPSLMYRFLPKGWAIAGVVIGALSELSTISMVLPSFSLLLPLARFSAMVWLIVAGVRLPRSKP